MGVRILSVIAAVLLLAALAGCTGGTQPPDPAATGTVTGTGETTTETAGGSTTDLPAATTVTYAIETDPSGHQVVVDDKGNVIATAGDGDTIETDPSGGIVIVGTDGSTKPVTVPTTAGDTEPSGTVSATDSPGTTGLVSDPTRSGTAVTGPGSTTGTDPTTVTGTEPGADPTQPADPAVPGAIQPGDAAAGVPFASIAKAPADNTVEVENATKQFGRFLITVSDNPGFPFNLACTLTEDRITGLVPAGTDLSAVKANFTYYGKDVTYNGAPLTSRSTPMDLRQDVTLTLNARDGSSRTVTVHIERLATGLPSMCLTVSGFGAINSNVEYKTASFAVGGGDKAVCSYAADSVQTGADCSVKGRGNTTWTYPKKSYTLRFDTKYGFLGLPETKNYVLMAMYADESLMRYRLGEYLSEQMGLEFTMNLRYVDLWLNGEYMGVYGLVEKIEVEKNHVNITDYTTTGVPANKIGYLLEFDDHLYNSATPEQRSKWVARGSNGYYDSVINEVFFHASVLGEDWITLRTTNAKNLTKDHVDYICTVVTKAMEALKDGDYSRISAFIDVESFVNWYLIEEYLNNTDSDMTSSVYMYIDVGGKLKLGPLWDLDNCAGNHTATASAAGHPLYDSAKGWFSYLFKCPEARSILKTRWAKMQTVLKNMDGTIDATAVMLGDAAALNFTRWPQLGTKLATQPAAVAAADTYEKQVAYLKTYLAERQTALNSFFGSL